MDRIFCTPEFTTICAVHCTTVLCSVPDAIVFGLHESDLNPDPKVG
jgi:hypothetical protein